MFARQGRSRGGIPPPSSIAALLRTFKSYAGYGKGDDDALSLAPQKRIPSVCITTARHGSGLPLIDNPGALSTAAEPTRNEPTRNEPTLDAAARLAARAVDPSHTGPADVRLHSHRERSRP